MEDSEEAGGMEGGEQSDHVELLAGKHIHIRAREGQIRMWQGTDNSYTRRRVEVGSGCEG